MSQKTHRVLIVSEEPHIWGGLKGTIELEFPSTECVIERDLAKVLQRLREERWDVVITEAWFSECPEGSDVAARDVGAWIWRELNRGRLSQGGGQKPLTCFVATVEPERAEPFGVPPSRILLMPFNIDSFLSDLEELGFKREGLLPS